ncbi:MAG: glycosyltransferase family 2 protein [Saprospiraceae bacterium]|nr:glycosyltransferase family 2 protein [Saprospiraceae bacterium]
MRRRLPLVSIIMAAKNTEPYIQACLDSVIAQTYVHWELIVVNDHSTDRTPQIAARYSKIDSRIKLFHTDEPKLIPALRYGYARSEGELINRMDSDDLMPSDKLETLVHTWLPYGRGTIIAGGTQHFVDQGSVGGGFLRYEAWLNEVARCQRHYEEIYKECVIPSHCWIIHRKDFDRVGAFNPDIYPEDYDLCFRFYADGLKVVGIDKILHYWRDRSDRISRTWDCYQDNRYFDLKIANFYALDRNLDRPLVLWGAGRNGKDMAKLLLERADDFRWVCDNQQKIGKEIYGVKMASYASLPSLSKPQIMVVVSSPDGQKEIEALMTSWQKRPVEDYWFFA